MEALVERQGVVITEFTEVGGWGVAYSSLPIPVSFGHMSTKERMEVSSCS